MTDEAKPYSVREMADYQDHTQLDGNRVYATVEALEKAEKNLVSCEAAFARWKAETKKDDEAIAVWQARTQRAVAELERLGYRRCDVAACNCGGYHAPPGHTVASLNGEREHYRERAMRAEAERDEARDLYRETEERRCQALSEREAAEAERDALRATKNDAYHERDQCVALIARMARALGCPVGTTRHPDSDTSWEDDWRTIVFIELPSGQVSWHFHDSEKDLVADLPAYEPSWDGHTTQEKYRRVAGARFADVSALRALLVEARDMLLVHHEPDEPTVHRITSALEE